MINKTFTHLKHSPVSWRAPQSRRTLLMCKHHVLVGIYSMALSGEPRPAPRGAWPYPQGQHYGLGGKEEVTSVATPHPFYFCSTGWNKLQLNTRGHGNCVIEFTWHNTDHFLTKDCCALHVEVNKKLELTVGLLRLGFISQEKIDLTVILPTLHVLKIIAVPCNAFTPTWILIH